MQSECGFIYHGPEGSVDVCTLTGRACLCVSDWQHCTRREYALKYQEKHPKVPRQMAGIIVMDGQGHIQDVL
jgi:hypothetical protein